MERQEGKKKRREERRKKKRGEEREFCIHSSMGPMAFHTWLLAALFEIPEATTSPSSYLHPRTMSHSEWAFTLFLPKQNLHLALGLASNQFSGSGADANPFIWTVLDKHFIKKKRCLFLTL